MAVEFSRGLILAAVIAGLASEVEIDKWTGALLRPRAGSFRPESTESSAPVGVRMIVFGSYTESPVL